MLSNRNKVVVFKIITITGTQIISENKFIIKSEQEKTETFFNN